MLSPLPFSYFTPTFTRETTDKTRLLTGQLSTHTGTWVAREIMGNPAFKQAQREQLAGEMLRFMMPNSQPTTYIACDSFDRYFILSQHKTNYTSLPLPAGYALQGMPMSDSDLRINTLYLELDDSADDQKGHAIRYAILSPEGDIIIDRIPHFELEEIHIRFQGKWTQTEMLHRLNQKRNELFNLIAQQNQINPYEFNTCAKSGEMSTFMLSSVWLHGNFTLETNPDGQIISLNSLQHFNSLDRPETITPKLIKSLPLLSSYSVHDWLAFQTQGNEDSIDSHLNRDPEKSIAFLLEVNQTLLKILLIPHGYLRRFVNTFINDRPEQEILLDFLWSRRQELLACALENESFQTYLETPEAQQDMQKHVAHMLRFRTQDDWLIVSSDEHDSVLSNAQSQWVELHANQPEWSLDDAPAALSRSLNPPQHPAWMSASSSHHELSRLSPCGVSSPALSLFERPLSERNSPSPSNIIDYVSEQFSRGYLYSQRLFSSRPRDYQISPIDESLQPETTPNPVT